MFSFRRKKTPPPPLRVAYDILRMTAGGANGGIKVHHYEFLRHFAEHHGHELGLVVLCREELVPELAFLSAGPYNQIHVIGEKGDTDYRDTDGSLPPLQFWPNPPEGLLEKLEIDVLYCGFGYSDFYSPNIPQVSLIVDALHKDLPDALPLAEVQHRDRWYREAIERSTFIQTNSQFCIESLIRHFDAPREKLFKIYLPLNGRFNRIEMGQLPPDLEPYRHRYFLYPANFWPHKNHECLLLGFYKYLTVNTEGCHLVFTGSGPQERQKELKELSTTLGIEDKVHFIGHLESAAFKALWELNAGLIFPSLYEGFGLPLLEAMHFQKPIACHRHETAAELLGESAIFFDGRKPAEIAQALCTLSSRNESAEHPNLKDFDFAAEAKSLLSSLKRSRASKR